MIGYFNVYWQIVLMKLIEAIINGKTGETAQGTLISLPNFPVLF